MSAGAPWQCLRHRRGATAATVRTNPEGMERVMQAEAIREQVEHAAKNTYQGPWGMVGMCGIRYLKGLILLVKFLSSSSCGHAVQDTPRPAEGSRPCSSTENMT